MCVQTLVAMLHILPAQRLSELLLIIAYFLQAKGVADAGSAAFRVSGLELGGLLGSLLAGRISDSLIASKPKGGNVGKRVQARRGSTALVDQCMALTSIAVGAHCIYFMRDGCQSHIAPKASCG